MTDYFMLESDDADSLLRPRPRAAACGAICSSKTNARARVTWSFTACMRPTVPMTKVSGPAKPAQGSASRALKLAMPVFLKWGWGG